MAYFKLTILSITVLIGIMHSLVHVSCQIFPQSPGIGPPNIFPSGNGLSFFPATVLEPVSALDRRYDERRTILLVEDTTLQNGGEFDSEIGGGFGGGFGSILVLLFIPYLIMALGLGVNTTTASVTGTTTMEAAITTPVGGIVTPAATIVTTASVVTTSVTATTTLPTTTCTDNSKPVEK